VVDKARDKDEGTNLAGSRVTKAADDLLSVEGVCGHFHLTHEGHFLVHADQHVFVDLNLKRRGFGLVSLKGVLVKPDDERPGSGGGLGWLSAVRRGLERPGRGSLK
jgi:hypothetical protein